MYHSTRNQHLHQQQQSPGMAEESSRAAESRVHLDRVFHLAARMLDELAEVRAALNLPLHMRIGVHCGDVVTGIVGSQRPRFCVLGRAVTEAEEVEGHGQLDCVTCTYEAHRQYLASAFKFSEVPGAISPGSRSHQISRFHVSRVADTTCSAEVLSGGA
jgi:class 3 adenylate cyclase